MKTHKNCKIYLIDTKNVRFVEGILSLDRYQEMLPLTATEANWKLKHLYVTSDEKPKEGDWVFNEDLQMVFIQVGVPTGTCEKVIATTDPLLNLPIIPQSFVQLYVENYQEGEVIKEVAVEYEECTAEGCNGAGTIATPFWEYECSDCNGTGEQLLTNPDNEISIKSVKESWSREEVQALVEEAYLLGYNSKHSAIPDLDEMNELSIWKLKNNL